MVNLHCRCETATDISDMMKTHYTDINPELRVYVEENIIPRYDEFDKAHRREHVAMVISQSLDLAAQTGTDPDMAYAVAAYHDTGLCEGREHHHEASARILRADPNLRRWFTEEQIDIMADAAEDHRASSGREPRSIYGKIVAEADRFIDADTVICRTIQFGLDHYPVHGPDTSPEATREAHYRRTLSHLREKYGRGGYLRLWFEDSPNARRLRHLQDIIDDEAHLRQLFNHYYNIMYKENEKD